MLRGPPRRSNRGVYWPQILVLGAVTFILIYALWAVQTLRAHYGGDSSNDVAPTIRVVEVPAGAALDSTGSQLRSQKAEQLATTSSGLTSSGDAKSLTNDDAAGQGGGSTDGAGQDEHLDAALDGHVDSVLEGQLEEAQAVGTANDGTYATSSGAGEQQGDKPSGTHEPHDHVDAGAEEGSASKHSGSSLPTDSLAAGSDAATTATSSAVARKLPAVSPKAGRSSGAQLTQPTEGGTLFSWGLKEWRLGRNKGDNALPEAALPELVVTSVAASRHSAAATSDGSVWTFGHNDSRGGGGHGSPPLDASGQLGREGDKRPGKVAGALAGKFVVQVVTGRYHTMAVTSDGELYTWGLNDWGQLGREAAGATAADDPAACTAGPSCHSGQPGLMEALSSVKVVGAAAGRYVSMALDDAGRLYTWGHDGCSNGGILPERTLAYKPRTVAELEGKPVVAFDAGYIFWIAATADGEVYTCDTQDDGYAGTLDSKRDWNDAGELGREGDPLVPGLVTGVLQGQKVVAVAAGREHAVVATADGKVFTWGGRDMLAGRSGDIKMPGQALGDLVNDHILFVAAGEYSSGAASRTMVYGWGSNDYLCAGVGLGNPVQILKPGKTRGPVMRPAKVGGPIGAGGWEVQAMVSGFQHVLAIAANKSAGAWVERPRGLAEGAGDAQGAAIASDEGDEQEYNAAAAAADGVEPQGTTGTIEGAAGAADAAAQQAAAENEDEDGLEAGDGGGGGLVERASEDGADGLGADDDVEVVDDDVGGRGAGGDADAAGVDVNGGDGAGEEEEEEADPGEELLGSQSALGDDVDDMADDGEQQAAAAGVGIDEAQQQDDIGDVGGGGATEGGEDARADADGQQGGDADQQQQQGEQLGSQQALGDDVDAAAADSTADGLTAASAAGAGAGTSTGAADGGGGADGAGSTAAATAAAGSSAGDAKGGAAAGAGADYHTRYLRPQLHTIKYNVSEYWHRYRKSHRIDLIREQSPDVFDELPRAYDRRYKNPCWQPVGSPTGTLRCLPYFHILGVSKCGTTDLYHRLSKHPQMFESRNKGPHWWDECPYPPKGPCTAPPTGNFTGYIDLFADAAKRMATEDTQGITGEASSNTFTAAMGVYLRGPSWNRNTTVTMPELMREASPFLRLITIFRNPVDRYFSAFYYYRWWLKDQPAPGPKEFHEAAVKDIATWRSCVEQHGQQYCVRHYDPQQLVKGMYSEFINDWLSNWPRDQLLFLRNEDYAASQREHMEAVLEFLTMRKPTGAEWEHIMGMKARNKNSDKYEPMLPETRKLLEDFFRPFNEKLARILGDDRYLWRDEQQTSQSSSTAAA